MMNLHFNQSQPFSRKDFISRNNRNNRNKHFQEILFMAIRRHSRDNYMLTIKHELPCNIHIIQVSEVMFRRAACTKGQRPKRKRIFSNKFGKSLTYLYLDFLSSYFFVRIFSNKFGKSLTYLYLCTSKR